MDVTLERALQWKWLHIDFGKEQYCAKFACGFAGFNINSLRHGDKFNGTKGIFRLIEKDLYDEEFVRQALPLLKEWWEQERKLGGGV
jgi:hypothetical protein